jgi:serine/threonine-protein kinase
MRCPSCESENEPGAEVCFNCRTVLSAITRGTMIASRYEVLDPLGKGGMGAVYKARDRVLDEVVAVKILRADVAGTPEMADRFRREIKLARRVSHFNVCRIHEYGEDGRLQFISMELVEGINLKELLKRRSQLPADEAFEIAIQAAEGLEAIHRVGIVHRDLKALNIMIDGAGVVRVMDFGIAKRMAPEGEGPKASGYIMGTPEYMSPEQGRGRKIDFRSDIYSLGIVVYELFTGRVPFRGDTPVSTLLMHVEQPPPLDEAASIPAALIPVLRRALAKDPAQRFATARELAEALRAARHAALGAAAISPATPQGTAPVRVPATVDFRVLGIVAGVATAVGALAFFLLYRPIADPSSSPPVPILSPPPVLSPSPVATPAASSAVPDPTPAAPATRVTPAPATDAAPVPPASSPTPLAAPPSEPRPVSPAPGTAPTPTPPTATEGLLLVTVTPWADVTVDGRRVGQTPLGPFTLAPGRHDVLLTHPRYEPYRRRVTISAGETVRLNLDFESDGIPRKR